MMNDRRTEPVPGSLYVEGDRRDEVKAADATFCSEMGALALNYVFAGLWDPAGRRPLRAQSRTLSILIAIRSATYRGQWHEGFAGRSP